MVLNMDYKTVDRKASAELIEKKSRFIAYVAPVLTEDEAIAFINEIKTKHWDASHNVYAYILRDNNIQRYSDDGEPSGTAGIPTLEVLKKEGIFNIAVVVTRYFGGTLLGMGPLARAYTNAARSGIMAAGIVTMTLCDIIDLRCDYTLWGRVQNKISSTNSKLCESSFSEDVNALVRIIKSDTDKFIKDIIDICSGRVSLEIVGEEYIKL